MAKIHDRMPVILPPSAWDTWLDRDIDDLELLGKLLVPADPSIITMHPVSTEVNNVRNDGAELTDEVDPGEAGERSVRGTTWRRGRRRAARPGARRPAGSSSSGAGSVSWLAKLIWLELGEGHEVDVGVRHLLADHEHADLGRLVDRRRGPGRSSGRPSTALALSAGVEVDPVVDGLDRHDEGVTGREEGDRQEGHHVVVSPHEPARDLALDDPGEDGGLIAYSFGGLTGIVG